MQTNAFRLGVDKALLVSGLLLLAACNRSDPEPPQSTAQPIAAFAVNTDLERAASTIAADDLRTHIAALSTDEMAGRGVATPGGELAMQYLETQLKAIGFEPGGENGTWRQNFDVIGMTAQPPKTWTFAHGKKQLALKWWDDYIAASGVQAPQVNVANAELVFVGYGIQAPEYQWDDFKGMDLKGKVLVMLNNDPDWDEQLFAGKTRLYYGRWTYKYESAARQGAAGAIIVHTVPSAGYPFQVVQTSWSGEQFELPATSEPRIQVEGWTTEPAMRSLLALAGQDFDKLSAAARERSFKPVPLGITTSIKFANTLRRQQTANILGVLPGSDAEFKQEAVVYTAHHDHLGIGQPDKNGDKIYNGALDNGAGMAQLLSIAKALKALPQAPKRSSLMLFVAAEEQGLLGSAYYAQHPTFPVGKIAANLNFDGGNIWGKTRDITFIGKGKSDLDAIVEGYAKLQGRIVLPDQLPDRGFYYRSDQFNFAKVGVPAVYLDNGTDFIGKPAGWGKEQMAEYETHRYHQASDELQDDWNFDGMIDDARLGLMIGVHVANQASMPEWNAGDEFELARKAAIEATQRAATP
jgi:Zn-dependent M28 family amino/carboxypeptidase